MNYCTVYEPGTTVNLGPAEDPVRATILDVSIKSPSVVGYRVAWWAKGEHKESWVEACEVFGVHGGVNELVNIGFQTPKE